MKQRITIIIMLAGLVTMLAGCAENISVRKGEQVRFTISAKGSPETKTVYSDVISDGFERIDWERGDKIRIVSSVPTIVGTRTQSNGSTQNGAFYDYEIASVTNNNDRYSYAKLTKPAEGEGLIWVDDPYGVTFYGSYPPVEFAPTTTNSTNVFRGMTIPASQTVKSVKTENPVTGEREWTRKNMKPSMGNAYMICVGSEFNEKKDGNTVVTDEFGQSIPEMNMEFYPVFNAFYVELRSEDGGTPIIVDAVSISSATDTISGSFYYSIGDEESSGSGVSEKSGSGTTNVKSVSVDLSSRAVADRTVKPAAGNDPEQSVVTTLLTLSPTGSKIQGANNGYNITNLTLHVTYHLQGQTQTSTAKLDLKVKGENGQKDKWLEFPAFQKARIIGLKMKGAVWQLTIKTDVNDWTFYSEELSSLNQINVDPLKTGEPATVKVTGSIETTQNWKNDNGGSSNHEIAYAGYDRYYQIRTLNWRQSEDKRFFEVSFTPVAPMGGYWQMVPEFIGTNSDKHFSFKVKIQGVSEWIDWVAQDSPHGQILHKKVYIRIYPKDIAQDDDNVYEMILKSYFSPNANFDPIYSADSELQDVHGNGQFSYWRFRIDKTAGSGNYVPTEADEHESLKPQD